MHFRGVLWQVLCFKAPAALTLDGKGRIAMPARHRELLSAMGVNQLTVTKHPKAR